MRKVGFSAVGLIRKRDRDRLEKQSKRNGGGTSLGPTIAVAVVVSVMLHLQQTVGADMFATYVDSFERTWVDAQPPNG